MEESAVPDEDISPTSHANAGACRRVLLVDDNDDVLRSLSRLLRLLGHDVRVASDGVQGVEVAADFRPEVVLLDIGLPKLDGYAVARLLRAQPWAKKTLIVAVSGWDREQEGCRSNETGFDDYVTKPIDLDTLRDLLKTET